jgi:hypothetical protein
MYMMLCNLKVFATSEPGRPGNETNFTKSTLINSVMLVLHPLYGLYEVSADTIISSLEFSRGFLAFMAMMRNVHNLMTAIQCQDIFSYIMHGST